MEKLCTLLTFARGSLQAGLPYTYLMTILSYVSIPSTIFVKFTKEISFDQLNEVSNPQKLAD